MSVDQSYYDEIQGLLRGLLIRLENRLPRKDQALVTEFLDHNELGLALETMADVLSEDAQPVSLGERTDMLNLAERMQVDDRVRRALANCPDG